jgi:glycine cleavage system H lipoate-binding protein
MPPAREPGQPGDEVFFEARAWMRLEGDGTVRAGVFLSGDEAAAVEAVRVAEAGDTARRGLPLAELRLAGGRHLVVPAPARGEVLEVNQALLAAPAEALRDPCATGWLARLQPAAAVSDLLASRIHRVVLASRDGDGADRLQEQLERCGCVVRTLADAAAVRAALGRTPGAVLLVDAESMGPAGLELVRAVGASGSKLDVVVLARDDAPYQVAYRTERVFYYAVTPLADGELVDILRSAFRPAARATSRRREPGALEPSLRAIRIRNRRGELVSLLTSGKLLYADHGLGGAILERLAGAACPADTGFGTGDLGMNEISQAVGANDRTLILWSHDTGRIPGSLECRPLFMERKPRPPATHAVTLTVQPGVDRHDPFGFEPALVDALAAVIVEEMTAPRSGGPH